MEIFANIPVGTIIAERTRVNLLRPLSVMGAIIRFFTREIINHVAIVYSEDGEKYVVESISKGVIKTKLSEWLYQADKRNNKLYLLKPIFSFNEVEISTYIKTFIGKRYDYESLLWYHFQYRFWKRWNGKTGDRALGQLYCSEVIAFLYKDYVKEFEPFWLITPADIFRNQNFIKSKL